MNESLHEISERQRVLLTFQFYYTPALVLLGTVGNTLSVFVFFSTKLRKLSSSYYLSALAISDTGFLVALFITWLNLIDVGFFNMSGVCQLTVYLTQVNPICSMIHVQVSLPLQIFRSIGNNSIYIVCNRVCSTSPPPLCY